MGKLTQHLERLVVCAKRAETSVAVVNGKGEGWCATDHFDEVGQETATRERQTRGEEKDEKEDEDVKGEKNSGGRYAGQLSVSQPCLRLCTLSRQNKYQKAQQRLHCWLSRLTTCDGKS